jgi:ABC-2 type transport system permease protein
MSWWYAEVLRWWREPGQRLILLVAGLAWAVAGVLGGLAAADHRTAQAEQHRQWEQRLEERRLSMLPADAAPARRAAEAFDLSRHLGPRIALVPGAGLALSPREAAAAPAIAIETRHFDSRKAEPLQNPALSAEAGTGLAWLVAVLFPLALIGACHGVRLGDREVGRWRWIASMSAHPWRGVLWALVIRTAALLLLAASASALAIGVDAGGSLEAYVAWTGALALYAMAWLAVVALVVALPVSAQGGTLALVGVWAVATFALPALLGEVARHQAAVPSRLAAVVESRKALQEVESHNDELLHAWYAAHPAWAAPSQELRHAWPVSFVPRYLELDRRFRPLMASFEAANARQAHILDRLAWLSPPLKLMAVGDALAGHTAARQHHHAREIEHREDEWRAQLVPAVMSYRGLGMVDFSRLRAAGRPVGVDRPDWPSSGGPHQTAGR